MDYFRELAIICCVDYYDLEEAEHSDIREYEVITWTLERQQQTDSCGFKQTFFSTN